MSLSSLLAASPTRGRTHSFIEWFDSRLIWPFRPPSLSLYVGAWRVYNPALGWRHGWSQTAFCRPEDVTAHAELRRLLPLFGGAATRLPHAASKDSDDVAEKLLVVFSTEFEFGLSTNHKLSTLPTRLFHCREGGSQCLIFDPCTMLNEHSKV